MVAGVSPETWQQFSKDEIAAETEIKTPFEQEAKDALLGRKLNSFWTCNVVAGLLVTANAAAIKVTSEAREVRYREREEGDRGGLSHYVQV